ncbi:alcohol dehydrogenase catalytic domain-containing protein [Candidatus Bipolaricaulota bacterium]
MLQELAEVPKPQPGPNDVLMKVHASSLNAADLEYLRGAPYVARVGTGLLGPKRPALGFDVAGTVEAVRANGGD